jgi:hypothetical protein
MTGEKKKHKNEEWYDDKCTEAIKNEECHKTMTYRYTRLNKI